MKPKIKLVEYCSRLAGSWQYKFDPEKDQQFIALGCACIKKNNEYKSSYDDCTHAALINDDIFIDYLISVVDDQREVIIATDDKKEAIQNYNLKTDYESLCNNELKNIFETSK